jgi:glycosyltransferase involved in cell wall biosynthesis
MKILLPCDSNQGLGGGFTFRRNLEKGLIRIGHRVVSDMGEADIALISSPTMVTWDTVEQLKNRGMKIVIRLDNVPRNSRNRNTGTSRLIGMPKMADEVVWQSEWARFYLKDVIQREGVIIYNGVDTDIFNKEGERYDFGKKENVYLYSRYNRDENKRYEEIWYEYQLIQRDNPDAKLILVGNFSPEQQEYNFDFFRNERFEYLGVMNDAGEMAKIYRGCEYMFAPYFVDCYSNTYLEALMCGVKLHNINMSGGTPELIENFKKGKEFNSLESMAKEYEKVFLSVLNR